MAVNLKAPKKTLFKNARLITMERGDIFHGDILAAEGKILKIASNIESQDAELVDVDGRFIMPSLFDMHVHLNSSEMLPLFIANGVTGVRNMWGFPLHFQWKKDAEEGATVSPYIYTTGPLTDGEDYWQGSLIVKTPEEAERAVRQVIHAGYQFFKTYPSIPAAAYLSLLNEAKKNNFKVCGHGSKELSWRTLSDFGYYCCEHTNCLPDDEGDIEYMSKSGMWLCPTHVVIKTIEDYVYNEGSFADHPHITYITKRNLKEWEDITVWRKTNRRYNLNEKYPMENIINRGKLFIKTAGSDKILLGTDTPNPGVAAGFPIFEELDHLVNTYGLSPFEALQTGTVNGAKHLGLENQKGKLLEGFDADFIVLREDPLADVKNTRTIEAVIQGGRLYDRAFLDGLLERARVIKDEEIVFIEDTPHFGEELSPAGAVFNEKTHAHIIGLFYKHLKADAGERGTAVFIKGAQKYGEQRGARMALRALRDGMPLDFKTYMAYGEWISTIPHKMTIQHEGENLVEHVTYCPWAEEFAAMGLKDCGLVYCAEIDKSIVRGFNPKLDIELTSVIHNSPECGFIFSGIADGGETINPPPDGKKDWAYHCAHAYTILKQNAVAAGISTSAEAVDRDFVDLYGEPALRVLSCRDENFNSI